MSWQWSSWCDDPGKGSSEHCLEVAVWGIPWSNDNCGKEEEWNECRTPWPKENCEEEEEWKEWEEEETRWSKESQHHG